MPGAKLRLLTHLGKLSKNGRNEMDWKVGDWVVFDLSVGQIKELRGEGNATFSDGHYETSGRLAPRFRPLTLLNKRIVESFDIYYNRLYEIDGHGGFNFPDISSYFSDLALRAIDAGDGKEFHELAQKFVAEAKDHKSSIQGIRLFRPAPRAAAL